MEPLAQMLADTPKDFKKQTEDSIGKDATAFKDNAWNYNLTRAASLLTFVCCLSVTNHQSPVTCIVLSHHGWRGGRAGCVGWYANFRCRSDRAVL